jgi:AraC-like DNA-binding protein
MRPMFEAIHSDADSSFRCLQFSCKRFSDDHTWHYHPEYELAYVVSSEGTRFIGDSIQHYGPGDLVLLGPNLPHCWNDEPHSLEIPTPELIVLQFTAQSFGDGFLSLEEAAPIKRLLESAEVGLHFSDTLSTEAADLMRAAVRQTGLDRLLRLLEILDLLARRRTSSPLATPEYRLTSSISPINQRRIEKTHRYIHENLAGEIRQADIAQMLTLSPPAFSRFFQNAMGRTFVTFVNTLRVNEACRRLLNSSLPVTEIAMACGYNNVSNFNRQFLAFKGMSPSAYRRYLRQKSERHSNYVRTHGVTGPAHVQG